jgi:cytochrome P450
MAGFDRTAVEKYLPELQRTIDTTLDVWADGDERSWVDELRRLAIGCIAHNMLGLEDPHSIENLVKDYAAVTAGLTSFPVAIPGSAMHRATEASKRLIAFMGECVAESRSAPRGDGLSRILLQADEQGATIADDIAALELHHVFLAGHVVFAELAALVLHLDREDDVRTSVRAEVLEHVPEGEITMSDLMKMGALHRLVQEVKRITPVFPILFARAKKTFTFKGLTIPEGWQVSLALHESHMLDGVYREPERFDPDRFTDERAEHRAHEHAFIPHGPGPRSGHKCAGADYSTYLMMMFTALLLRGYSWELPEQRIAYDFGHLPPEPRDGLRVRLTPASDRA